MRTKRLAPAPSSRAARSSYNVCYVKSGGFMLTIARTQSTGSVRGVQQEEVGAGCASLCRRSCPVTVRLCVFVLSLLALTACAAPEEVGISDYGDARITERCAIGMGFITDLSLATTVEGMCSPDGDLPQLSFNLPAGDPFFNVRIEAGTIVSTPEEPAGMATECFGGSAPCRFSQDFTVTLDTLDEEGAEGTYVVRWVDGAMTEGAFLAVRCAGPEMCF